MKKIAIISNGIGIVYKFRLELLQKLKELKYKIYIISPIEETDQIFYELLKKEDVEICEIKMNRRGKNLFEEFKVIFQYYNLLKKINPVM